jgi:5-hydroxyisourate hydrolase-like protein (transthyretin family)
VHDRSKKTTRRASVTYDGAQANGGSHSVFSGSRTGFAADISADGRWVGFYSSASNLISNDKNGKPDVFVRDMTATWKTTTFLTFKASPVELTKYGATSTLTGTLRKGSPTGTPMAGVRVAVQKYSGGIWKTVKTVTTSSTGRVKTTVKPSRNTTYRLRYMGKPGTYTAAESRKVRIYTTAKLTAPVAKRIATREYRIYTEIWPKHTAGLTSLVRVYLAKYVGGKWVQQDVGTRGYLKAKVYDYGDHSRARADFKFPSKGKWRIRAVSLYWDCMKSKSPYSYVTVY